MASPQRTALKTGKRRINANERTFRPGENMFIEGSHGRELYVLQQGRLGVYKQTPEGEIELAQIATKGAVIGEMSLLDNLPRSATVRALEKSTALLIDHQIFESAVKKIPVWLNSIIKIVISRLRDANLKVHQSPLRDTTRGCIGLINLMLTTQNANASAGPWYLDYTHLMAEIYFVCRLKKKEIVHFLETMQKKRVLSIEQLTDGKKRVSFEDPLIPELFEEYLELQSRDKTFGGLDISDETIAMLRNLRYTAQKVGTVTNEGTEILRSRFLADLDEKESKGVDEKLKLLQKHQAIHIYPSRGDVSIIVKKQSLDRIDKIKKYVPHFQKGDA